MTVSGSQFNMSGIATAVHEEETALTTDRLWPSKSLRQVLAIAEEVPVPEVDGIDIDSRRLTEGSLFIPLAPPHAERDGHNFIDAALEQGAAAALSHLPIGQDLGRLPVDDTYIGLQHLARAARSRVAAEAKIIALTGSSGKTTLRSWLQHLLSDVGLTHGSEGSFNNHLGVPLSLARMPSATQFGLFEIGTNHPGEIAPLSRLVDPDVAIVLNVLPVHIGHFESFEALQAEKTSIAEGLDASGQLVVEASIPIRSSQPITRFKVLADGPTSPNPEEAAWDTNDRPLYAGQITINEEVHRVLLPAPGSHLLATAAACLATYAALGLDLDAAKEKLKTVPIPKGRGQRTDIRGITLVDESYNANPDSMMFALEALHTRAATHRHVILGEMHELGDYAAEAHERVLEHALRCDSVIVVGEGFRTAAMRLGVDHLASVAELDLKSYIKRLGPGDTVMVKGSNRVFWVHQFVQQLSTILEGG